MSKKINKKLLVGLLIILTSGLVLLGCEKILLKPDIFDSCKNSGDVGTCHEKYVIDVLKKKDISAAFAVIDDLRKKDPNFALTCHGFAHMIGAASLPLAFKRVDVFTKPLTSCEKGYYHGLLMEMVMHAGDLSYAANYCAKLKNISKGNTSVVDACYHGIGHGLPLYLSANYKDDIGSIVKKSIQICNDTFEAEIECKNGIFGGVASLITGEHGIKFDVDPKKVVFETCMVQSADLKQACYEMMGQALLTILNENVSKVVDLSNSSLISISDKSILANILGMNITVADESSTYKDINTLCATWKNERLRLVCIQGYFGAKVDTKVIKDFDSDILSFCSGDGECRGIALAIAKDAITQTQFSELCKKLSPDEYAKYCSN